MPDQIIDRLYDENDILYSGAGAIHTFRITIQLGKSFMMLQYIQPIAKGLDRIVRRTRKNPIRISRMPPSIGLLLLAFVTIANSGYSQNITPRPTSLGLSNAVKAKTTPTPISHLNVSIQRIPDVRLEAASNNRMVFSKVDDTVDNKPLYVWEPGKSQLIDTGEEGLSQSVVMPDDGRYMIFLYDETDGRNINGDGTLSVVLRMYHFASGQRVNLDLPARSATPGPNETRATFEYRLQNNFLAYSKSDSLDNSQRNTNAPWQIMNILDILYTIEGTPTPTPSLPPVVVGTPTPTPTPTRAPTPTKIPTIPPELRSKADINADGNVDTLDLLLFQYFWRQ